LLDSGLLGIGLRWEVELVVEVEDGVLNDGDGRRMISSSCVRFDLYRRRGRMSGLEGDFFLRS
jgi:hypothetical protein